MFGAVSTTGSHEGLLLAPGSGIAAVDDVRREDRQRLGVGAGMFGSTEDACLLWVEFFFLPAVEEGSDPG